MHLVTGERVWERKEESGNICSTIFEARHRQVSHCGQRFPINDIVSSIRAVEEIFD